MAILFLLLFPFEAFGGRSFSPGDVHVDIRGDERGLLRSYDAGSRTAAIERRYIIARKDERYSIRVSNRSPRRIGVVVAVDGRNVISGKKSTLKSSERMYILGPYESQEYDGWRTGRNQVNRFYFTNIDDSYAAHWEDRTAMGVIAVAVYDERRPGIHRKKHNNSFGSKGQNRAPGNFNMHKNSPGTGFGEDERSPSRTVHFAAAARPSRKMFIKYEWRKSL